MFASRIAVGLAILLLATSAGAEPGPGAGRLEVLAAEMLTVGAPGSIPWAAPAGGSPGPWTALAVVMGAIAAAFAGSYLGQRRFSFCHLREQDGWREVTYRFRGKRVRLQADVLKRLPGVLDEIEEVGARLRATPAETPTTAKTEQPPPPPAPPRKKDDRESRYERARAMLREGHDTATVRACTELKTAEIDLLRATAGAPTDAEG